MHWIVVRTHLKNKLRARGPACGGIAKRFLLPCMLRFFTVPRLALNPNLVFEMGSNVLAILHGLKDIL
jgi:hypothetical protein